MILNILNIGFESLLFLVAGVIIIFILSALFRISFEGKIFKIFLGLIIINSALHFLSGTNPEQNRVVLLLSITVFYVFLFFILKILKKGADKVYKINFKYIFILFIFVLMFLGKGEYLERQSTSVGSELSVGSQGQLFYKGFKGIRSNLGFFNEYGDKIYDTVKYDIDMDGFVDLKIIDNNDDGVINETIIKTYDFQKILIVIYLLISIALVYSFSNGENRFLNKKTNDNKNKDKNKNDGNNGKKLDLSGLSIKKDKDNKDKDKSNNNNWEDNKDKNKNGEDNKGNDKNNSIKKYISLIVLFSILTSFFNLNNISFAQEEMSSLEVLYLKTIIKKECAKYPFDNSKCVYVDHFTRIFLQSTTKTKKSMDLYSQIIKEELRCYKNYNDYTCNGNDTKKLWDLQSKWKGTFWDKYKKKYPIKRKNILCGSSILDSKYTWLKCGILSVSLEKQSDYLYNFKKNNNIKEIYERKFIFGTSGSSNKNPKVNNNIKGEDTNIKIDNKSDSNGVDKKVKPIIKKVIPPKIIKGNDIDKKRDNKTKNNTGKKQVDDNGFTGKQLDDLAVEIAGDSKSVTDLAGGALSSINYILGDKLPKDINNSKNYIKKVKKIKDSIVKNIRNKFGKGGDKPIEKIKKISDKIKKVSKNNPKQLNNFKKKVKAKVGTLGSAVDALGKIGTVLDIFGDYKNFDKKSGGNQTKTFIGTTVTTLLKDIVGSNPLDITIDIVGGGLNLLGYPKIAETLGEYSIGDRAKQMVEDSILSETDETIGAMDQTLDDFLNTYNDPKTSIIDKSSSFAVSTIVFGYGTMVFGMNQVLGGVESGINAVVGK